MAFNNLRPFWWDSLCYPQNNSRTPQFCRKTQSNYVKVRFRYPKHEPHAMRLGKHWENETRHESSHDKKKTHTQLKSTKKHLLEIGI